MPLIVFLRTFLFLALLFSFVMCMIVFHLLNALLFYFTHPALFKLSMQWSQHLCATLLLLLTHLYTPYTNLKVSFADETSKQKFVRFLKSPSAGTASSDIVICNHQLYTDWIYIFALLTHLGKGGNIKITLKKAIQWIPVVGWGMKLVGFIFISRKWSVDREKFLRRIARLAFFKPFSFLIFPEGTTLSKPGVQKSNQYAQQEGIKATTHVMIPRTLGMYSSLLALRDHIDGVWDLTLCYSDISSHTTAGGSFPEDVFGLASLFGHRKAPRNAHFVVRFIPLQDIEPHLGDMHSTEKWLRGLFLQKDAILSKAYTSGEYPKANFTLPLVKTRDVQLVCIAVFALMAVAAYYFLS